MSSAAGEALEDVTFYFFAPGPNGKEDRDFTHRIDAKRAELKAGFWQLQDTIRKPADRRKPAGRNHRPGLAGAADQPAQRCPAVPVCFGRDHSLLDLPNFIRTGQDAGMEVDAYILKFHTLLATPFFMMANVADWRVGLPAAGKVWGLGPN